MVANNRGRGFRQQPNRMQRFLMNGNSLGNHKNNRRPIHSRGHTRRIHAGIMLHHAMGRLRRSMLVAMCGLGISKLRQALRETLGVSQDQHQREQNQSAS